MNKLYLLVVVFFVIFSCKPSRETDGFELKITLEGDAPKSVAVMVFDNQTKKTIDSAAFENNVAILKGNLDHPTACFLQFFGDQPSQPMQLFLENGKLELKGSAEPGSMASPGGLTSDSGLKLTGSESQDELQALIDDQREEKRGDRSHLAEI